MRMLVSPAVRTRQTAAHFCEDESKFQLCQALYDNVPPGEILEIICSVSLPTLVVGHEPQIRLLADLLLAGAAHPEGNPGPWSRRKVPESFRKGALWQLRIEGRTNSAQLVHVIEP